MPKKRATKKTRKGKVWESYEAVAEYLIGQLATHFGLGSIEGKQIIPGDSGTNWEIEAKGIQSKGGGFLIIECRRYTKSRLNQESVGGLAFRIRDTGAAGGIIVSPLPLQKGAKLIAAHSNIRHVILDPASTTSDYLLRFLNQVFLGVADSVALQDSHSVTITRSGKVIHKRNA